MIYPESKPLARPARGAETYEVKCQRRQETRESRRRRPNMTTCRQMRRTRRPRNEQTQSPRQQQFLKRRNLEVEEEKGSLTETQQVLRKETDLQVSNLCNGMESTSGQQEFGTNTEVFSIQHHPSPGNHKDPPDHPSICELLPVEVLVKKSPTLHQGTQTKSLGVQLTIKNDASQQTNCGIAVLDKEIIQLSDYLKEALQRELVLKHKMVVLQELLSTLLQASDRSWKGIHSFQIADIHGAEHRWVVKDLWKENSVGILKVL